MPTRTAPSPWLLNPKTWWRTPQSSGTLTTPTASVRIGGPTLPGPSALFPAIFGSNTRACSPWAVRSPTPPGGCSPLTVPALRFWQIRSCRWIWWSGRSTPARRCRCGPWAITLSCLWSGSWRRTASPLIFLPTSLATPGRPGPDLHRQRHHHRSARWLPAILHGGYGVCGQPRSRGHG